ncbi:MAG: FAD-binding oxidoreductase [Pseudomonadota bacterium]|nr:FAD-binding oxidoreductase [Pseudomonadota bacterium]
MTHTVTIQAIEPVTHDVHHFKTTRPEGFAFTPGQACEMNLAKDGWREEQRPFTFTSLPDADHLEFTIKSYTDHEGVTAELARALVGDRLEITDPWGTIEYRGKGTFIAGGAGITPFIAILRKLKDDGALSGHRLVFANKQERDIIIRDELDGKMPGLEVVHVLSDDPHKSDFEHGFVDRQLLERHVDDFSQHFYVCGPKPMQDSVMSDLKALGADPDGLVFEK